MFRVSLYTGASVLALMAAAAAQQNQPQTFYSQADAASVETVVVTANPLTTDADATAVIAAKIDRAQILQNGGETLADALSGVPGVTGTGFAAGASRPVIRGFDSNRVRLMEDGVGSFDVSDIGPDHGVPIDPMSAQSIEVVRGAATLRYGSNAIGGVVNTVNNRVPQQLPQEAQGDISAAYGSSSNLAQSAAATDFAVGKFAVHADGFYRTAGDYETPEGREDNSFAIGSGLSLGTSYFFGDADHVGAAVIQNDAKYGIPGEDTFILMRQTKVLANAVVDIGTQTLGALTVNGGYANYSHEEKNPDGTVNTTFKNDEFEGRAEQMIGAIGPFSSTAVGIQVQSRAYQALGEDSSYLYPTYTGSFAGFFFTEAPLTSDLRLQLGGRIEQVRVSGTPASGGFMARSFTPLSGAVSLVYDATDWLRLGLTASSAGRAPAQTELFARGPHDGPDTFETGNPALKIERANALELSARVRTGRFTFDGSLWRSQFDNYIYGALTGRMCDDDGTCAAGSDGDLKELNYDQSGARFWGGEAKAGYALGKLAGGTLTADMQYDYVRAKLSSGGNVPRIPPYHVGGGLTFAATTYDASVQVLYAGRQTDYGAYDTATPGYVEVNANVSWKPLTFNPGFTLALSAHNLTDDVQRNATALNKDDVLLPGRDVRLVLRQTF